MKGVSVLVGAAIMIVITITAIFLVLDIGNPSIDKAREILIMQEGKSILLDIDNTINSVLTEGNGSTRLLNFNMLGGNLKVDGDNNAVTFYMESRGQIVGVGVTKMEDGINITGAVNKIYLNLSYDNVDILGSFEYGRGNRKLTIRNEGYNATIEKQIILIS